MREKLLVLLVVLRHFLIHICALLATQVFVRRGFIVLLGQRHHKCTHAVVTRTIAHVGRLSGHLYRWGIIQYLLVFREL